jgi:hypothetical protein
MFRETENQRLRNEHKKETSKKRLKDVGQQKIKTTMIGAIASIEEHFGFLWDNNPDMKNVFDLVRSEILDKGNTQIRNFEVELSNYDIIWNKYRTVLPVKRKE